MNLLTYHPEDQSLGNVPQALNTEPVHKRVASKAFYHGYYHNLQRDRYLQAYRLIVAEPGYQAKDLSGYTQETLDDPI